MKKIVFDCDNTFGIKNCDVDDGLALMYLLGSREAEFLGVTSTYGNSSLDVPLRYNNDKQKKPLFSRGLSVCRLLFNSFSKLKIDENYKEKRRLFY